MNKEKKLKRLKEFAKEYIALFEEIKPTYELGFAIQQYALETSLQKPEEKPSISEIPTEELLLLIKPFVGFYRNIKKIKNFRNRIMQEITTPWIREIAKRLNPAQYVKALVTDIYKDFDIPFHEHWGQKNIVTERREIKKDIRILKEGSFVPSRKDFLETFREIFELLMKGYVKPLAKVIETNHKKPKTDLQTEKQKNTAETRPQQKNRTEKTHPPKRHPRNY